MKQKFFRNRNENNRKTRKIYVILRNLQSNKFTNINTHINSLRKRIQNLTALNKHLHDNNLMSDESVEYFNVSMK